MKLSPRISCMITCILSLATSVYATEMQEPYIPISARPLAGPKSWSGTPPIAKHTACLVMCTAYQHSCYAVSVHNDKSTCIFGNNGQGNWTQTLWCRETSKNEWTSYALISGNIYEYQTTSTHAIMIYYIFGYSKCMPMIELQEKFLCKICSNILVMKKYLPSSVTVHTIWTSLCLHNVSLLLREPIGLYASLADMF